MIKWRLSVYANAEIAPYFIVALTEATDGKIGLKMIMNRQGIKALEA